MLSSAQLWIGEIIEPWLCDELGISHTTASEQMQSVSVDSDYSDDEGLTAAFDNCRRPMARQSLNILHSPIGLMILFYGSCRARNCHSPKLSPMNHVEVRVNWRSNVEHQLEKLSDSFSAKWINYSKALDSTLEAEWCSFANKSQQNFHVSFR